MSRKYFNEDKSEVKFKAPDGHTDPITGDGMTDKEFKKSRKKKKGESDYQHWCRTFDIRHCVKL